MQDILASKSLVPTGHMARDYFTENNESWNPRLDFPMATFQLLSIDMRLYTVKKG